MAEHNDFGKKAEELAASFLEKKGYKILVKNYHYLKAEIDIVAETKDAIVIVEVKARKTDLFNTPEQAVDKKKMKLIVKAADHFMENLKSEKEVRFDIISIISKGENHNIQHIEDAFSITDSI
jgi:putative endonuclease